VCSKLLSLEIPAQEVALEIEQFDELPVKAILRYLDFFTAAGEQEVQLPRHVAEAIARRFRMFVDGQKLDDAFGGTPKLQLKAISAAEKDSEILFQYFVEYRRVPATPPPIALRDGGPEVTRLCL